MTNTQNMEARPWGYFIVLDDGNYGKTKRIHVYPNQKLSYQSHEKRSELWTIMQGTGYVIIDDVIQRIGPGSIIHIPAGKKHRICNDHDLVPIVFIEVQYGTYFGEDDIVRYFDEYGRS